MTGDNIIIVIVFLSSLATHNLPKEWINMARIGDKLGFTERNI